MTNKVYQYVWIAIRALMAAMFVESFIDKLLHWEMYLQETVAKGIPFPVIGLGLAAVTELLGSVALLSGFYIRVGAFILAAYVFTLGFFYFDFWNQQGMAAVMARKEFLKDFAVIAGLCLIVTSPVVNKPSQN